MSRLTVSAIVLILVAALAAFFLVPESAKNPPPIAEYRALTPVGLYLAGIVVDGIGNGIASASVNLGETQVKTNELGEFRFENLEPGQLVLHAQAEGFVSKGPPGGPLWEGELQAKHPLSNLRLVLHKSGIATGHVVAGRMPLSAQLTILYSDDDGEYSVEAGQTDSKTGAFTIRDLAPGPIRILVEADGNTLFESDEFLISEGATLDGIIIDVRPVGVLRGVVRDQDGLPLGGAELVLTASGGSQKTKSQNNGRFVFTGVPDGFVTIRARQNGYPDEIINDVVFANETTDMDLEMERTPGAFGQLFDSEGPVYPAVVTVVGELRAEALTQVVGAVREFSSSHGRGWAHSTRDGAFKLLVQDAVEVTVASPFHLSKTVRVVPGVAADIELTRGGTVLGRVLDEAGNPVYQAKVSVATVGADQHWFDVYRNLAVNVTDGSFEYGPLRPGKYKILASSDAHSARASETFEIIGSQRISGVQIVLSPLASLEGVVRAVAGYPLKGAAVRFFRDRSGYSESVEVTADGRYRIDHVPLGPYTITVSRWGYVGKKATHSDIKPGPNQLDVWLEPNPPKTK
jgi:hypothetical protein